MNLLFWGLTVGLLGKILLVVGVLLAHNQIAHEHRIDNKVIRTLHTEKIITIIGLGLLVIGYCLEIYFYGLTDMLTCSAFECAANLGVLLSQ